MKAVLLLWAIGATVLAAVGWMREPAQVRRASARPSVRPETRVRRLQSRVDKLEAALAATLKSDESRPASKDAKALMAEDLALQKGDWNQNDSARIGRDIMRLIMSDAQSHRDLIALLETSPDQANDIQGYLLSNFAGLVRNTTVTAEIREIARRLIVEGSTADQREAAARILMGYASPAKNDVLLALERLNREPDDSVRETLLEVISDRGRAVGLTEQEAAPILQGFREGLRGGQLWHATALARWSGSDADYDLVQAEFRSAADNSARMELLNAFMPETRLASARVDRSKAFLLEVVTSETYADDVRDMALRILKDYAPWDRETAETVRRARSR
ncbi:MAG: hypothetical protein ACYTEG_05180 [Planctomycetota bacterium]